MTESTTEFVDYDNPTVTFKDKLKKAWHKHKVKIAFVGGVTTTFAAAAILNALAGPDEESEEDADEESNDDFEIVINETTE